MLIYHPSHPIHLLLTLISTSIVSSCRRRRLHCNFFLIDPATAAHLQCLPAGPPPHYLCIILIDQNIYFTCNILLFTFFCIHIKVKINCNTPVPLCKCVCGFWVILLQYSTSSFDRCSSCRRKICPALPGWPMGQCQRRDQATIEG